MPGVLLGSIQVSFLPGVFAVGKSNKKMGIEGGTVKKDTLPRSNKAPLLVQCSFL